MNRDKRFDCLKFDHDAFVHKEITSASPYKFSSMSNFDVLLPFKQNSSNLEFDCSCSLIY